MSIGYGAHDKIVEYLDTCLGCRAGEGSAVRRRVLRRRFCVWAGGETVAVYRLMRYNNNRVFIIRITLAAADAADAGWERDR